MTTDVNTSKHRLFRKRDTNDLLLELAFLTLVHFQHIPFFNKLVVKTVSSHVEYISGKRLRLRIQPTENSPIPSLG